MAGLPVELDKVFGCRLWTGRLDKDGYPLTDDGQRAHLVIYRQERGPIPDDHELDHGCRRRRCVEHLQPVTRAENEKRKRWAYRLKIAQCPRGHALTPATAMITPEGGRVCRTCRDATA